MKFQNCSSYKFILSMSRIGAMAIFMLSSISAFSMSLPIKVINGKQYYYREVKSKETVYGICRELGITKAQLVQYNPSVADGLRNGTVLYFPVDELNSDNTTTAATSTASTTTIAGSQSHLVEKGETIYGISKRYGISQDDLMAANPSLKDGLKTGTLLTIPSAAATDEVQVEPEPEPEVTVVPATPVVSQVTPATPVTPVYHQPTETQPVKAEDIYNDTETVVLVTDTDDNIATAKTTKIAVVLPFMLNSEHTEKSAQLYTEFYKGMLLAADSLRHSPAPVEIIAFDSAANTDTVSAIIRRGDLDGVNIIISPDDESQFELLANYAKNNNAYVFNIFAVKNTRYLNDSHILQANIPHSSMYGEAADAFIARYGADVTPVFVTTLNGKNDKADFTDLLRTRLKEAGRNYIEVTYNSYLKKSDLDKLSHDTRYVFVPAFGSSTEFSHIISTLKAYREELDDYTNVQMFGYPEWITMRSDAIENLHLMNTTIYSRFYNDADSYRSKQVSDAFKKWYGSQMMSAIPVQGILGFDTGFYLINAINRNAASVVDDGYSYDGVQSAYHFSTANPGGGKVNDTLYFINFRPSGITDKLLVK